MRWLKRNPKKAKDLREAVNRRAHRPSPIKRHFWQIEPFHRASVRNTIPRKAVLSENFEKIEGMADRVGWKSTYEVGETQKFEVA